MTSRILAAAVSLLWLPCMLRAQGIQTISWTELGQRANRQKVVVSLKSGDIVQGKVVGWDGRSFTIRRANAGTDREIFPSEVSLVQLGTRRGWAGRYIGLAAGAALGTATGVSQGSQRAGREAGPIVVGAAASAGLGFLIGWGVDALRSKKPALYRIQAEP